MKKKLIGLLLVSFISVTTYGESKKDTVVVNGSSIDNVEKTFANSSVDTVKVEEGNHSVYIYEDHFGDVSVWTSKRKRNKYDFVSHLSGVYLGLNTYLNKDFKMEFPEGYEDMDLNMTKSVNFGITFASVDQRIFGRRFGLTAAIGTEWHNYRFSEDVTLSKDKVNRKVVVVALPEDENIKKTKLTDWWLNVPVALEYNCGKFKSFYISAGAIGSILLNSHTKVVSGSDKEKEWNKCYMNPFRVSLIAKAGYGNFGLYATYSLTEMFQNNKGPELYPFSAGVTLNFF